MITPFHLVNKKILITGASSGIGKQVALSCALMGADVIVTGTHEERLNETFNALNEGSHQKIICDLKDEASLEKLISSLTTIDGVVNCAGLVDPFPIGFLNKHKIDATFELNFYATVQLCNNLLRSKKIKDNASFVFLSSISGQHPHKGNSLYAASKAAIEAFSKTLALEFSHRKIRSNSLAPALVQTHMLDYSFKNLPEEQLAIEKNKYPLGFGTPEDVANFVIFLLSDASKWITGQNYVMDGGLLLKY